ncbi:MAG: glycoside hydrolase, partial [Chloroflexota bacterium]|nr:glycoside hydrolase [Chloroflexota bacterium]
SGDRPLSNVGRTVVTTLDLLSRCAGGTAANKGNYERASDPQVILVSRSINEGRTWSEPIPLIADTDPTVVDDKESITADPKDSRLVYAVGIASCSPTRPDQ